MNLYSPGFTNTVLLRAISPAFACKRKPKPGTKRPCSVSPPLLSRTSVTMRPAMTRTFAGAYLNSVEATQTSPALEPGASGRTAFSAACVQVTAAAPLTATKPKVIVQRLQNFSGRLSDMAYPPVLSSLLAYCFQALVYRLDRCSNRRSGPLWRRIPLEDEMPAGLVIGEVGPEEIDLHSFQLFGAIVREGLDVSVVETPLVLYSKPHAEFRIPGEAPRPLPQLGLERPGILAEGVVEKSHLPRRPRADRPAGRGQLQRPPLPHPPRQRIGPVFRSEETAHAPVVGGEDEP